MFFFPGYNNVIIYFYYLILIIVIKYLIEREKKRAIKANLRPHNNGSD